MIALSTVRNIPAGEAGTDQTVTQVVRLASAALRRPVIRLKTLKIFRDYAIPNHSTRDQADAIYRWVKENILYVRDPIDIETVADPEMTLRIGAGDCDDHSTLIAAMAAAVGIPVRFRVIGPDPSDFRHIFPELMIDGRWIPADTTASQNLGDRPPVMTAEKIYPFDSKENNMAGPISTIPRQALLNLARTSAMDVLASAWNDGLIDRADLISSLAAVDQKQSPFEGTIVKNSIRQAIGDFLSHVTSKRIASRKSLGGLSGVDDFLEKVWNGVKGSVNSAWQDLITAGESSAPINIAPITANVSPESARAAVMQFFKNPIVLGVAGVLAFALLRKRGRR